MPPPPSWIVGLAAVVFDADVGQKIDVLVPEGALTPAEAHAVAMCAFPDSQSQAPVAADPGRSISVKDR
jgi:hypothetical protein